MQITGSFFPYPAGGALGVQATSGAKAAGARPAMGAYLRDFAKRLVELRDAHEALGLSGRFARIRGGLRSASAVSQTSLGLSTSRSETTLRSVEEVNTLPTSYSTTRPVFAGSSSTRPSIGGTYSGVNGDDTLTFRATLGGIIGLTPARVEVRDSGGTLLDTINTGFNAPGTVYTLSNGLQLSFSSGSVQGGDSFQLGVSATVGSAVRPSNAFNGTGDQAPGFQPGLTVSTGTLQINGVSIAVNASDSLDSVLARITASAAGVTATFDETTETVLFTQKTAGASPGIVLGSDSSGFLAAVKLTGAVAVPGSLDERTEPIGQVPALAGISSGTFRVNGVAIELDVLQHSLEDLLDLIDEADANAIATYDATTGRLRVRATAGATLSLDSGDTNVFVALGIEDGSVASKRTGSSTKFKDAAKLQRDLGAFVQAYQQAFSTDVQGFGAASANSLRTQFENLVSEVFGKALGKSGPSTIRSGLGLDLVTSRGSSRLLGLDPARLSRALGDRAEDFATLLFADEDSEGFDGLVPALGKRIEEALRSVGGLLGADGSRGLNLDVSA